jgi:hypothetical protein
LIGVISKPEQAAAVEEFFQLFKTPWEFYRSGCHYDVVVATAEQIPGVTPRLLLIYSADGASSDRAMGIRARQRRSPATLNYEDEELPIYGELVTFEATQGMACVMSGSEPAGIRIDCPGMVVMRLGYDLFEEASFLLSTGQPLEHAHIPALDFHIEMLRSWIVGTGLTLVEIPPAPAGYGFCVCLTHDIDFVGIRNHKLDHTMWGFLYRSTMGALMSFVRGRICFSKLLKSWRAALSLPLVYAGWLEDFWEPFAWYLRVEEGLPATYFLIPFQGRRGEKVNVRHASRRAAGYDVVKLGPSMARLMESGSELGVHGVDAWHSAEKGREELARIAQVCGGPTVGIRMHWLLRDQNTSQVLEQAGFAYDSTIGYNETVGYRSGTTQVFRPFGTHNLLELPLHIQDGALFYPGRLNLPESRAWNRCEQLVENTRKSGGVLTLLWHDRSHAPERFWGDFYVRLIDFLRSTDAWFGSAAHVTGWFRKRREVSFTAVDGRITLRYEGVSIAPALKIRVHRPAGQAGGSSGRDSKWGFVDIPWQGGPAEDLDQLLHEDSIGPDTSLDQPAPARVKSSL